jgi:hypothetical protein
MQNTQWFVWGDLPFSWAPLPRLAWVVLSMPCDLDAPPCAQPLESYRLKKKKKKMKHVFNMAIFSHQSHRYAWD